MVALFTRAWIEIFLLNFMLSQDKVALFTRAWIEIVYNAQGQFAELVKSPSSRGRGLKYKGTV